MWLEIDFSEQLWNRTHPVWRKSELHVFDNYLNEFLESLLAFLASHRERILTLVAVLLNFHVVLQAYLVLEFP